MSDDTIRLVTLGRIVRRRRRLLILLTVLGALAGYGVSLLFPPQYTASASVLLPGAWEQRELLTQTEIASSSVVVDRAAAQLGWKGADGRDLRSRVSATAADGNIVTISGTASSPGRAQQLADQVAQQFVAFAARIGGDSTSSDTATGPDALRQLVVQTGRRITELADATDPGRTVESVQTRTELAKLRTALQEAVGKLDETGTAAGKSNMVVMGPAPRPSGQAPPTRVQLVAGGALLFFVLAVIGHLTASRVNRRLRTGAEIGAALGAVALGTVDVPGERGGRRAGKSRRSDGGSGDDRPHRPGDGPEGSPHASEIRPRRSGGRLRRLLGADVRWDVPPPRPAADEEARRTRYRRVCARLRGRRLLVVVPAGDGGALRAAELLAAEAGGDPVLRVVEVAVERPTVPDRGVESGALIVLSPGEWTAADLTGVADACADAGHDVAGVVLAETTAPAPAPERPREAAPVGGSG